MWKESKWIEVLYVIQVKLLSAKNRLLSLEGISCKPGGKHKAKTYSRYKKIKQRIKAYCYRKSSTHKGRRQKREKRTARKRYDGTSKSLPINNCLKRKWIEFSSQKAEGV